MMGGGGNCLLFRNRYGLIYRNIAIGTTDPEIDYITWTKFGNHPPIKRRHLFSRSLFNLLAKIHLASTTKS